MQKEVHFIYPAFGVTLRNTQREHFLGSLDSIFPGERLSDKYIHRFGNSYECTCPNVKVLWKAFTEECEKYGILYKMQDIISASKLGYEYDQMSLFE